MSTGDVIVMVLGFAMLAVVAVLAYWRGYDACEDAMTPKEPLPFDVDKAMKKVIKATQQRKAADRVRLNLPRTGKGD